MHSCMGGCQCRTGVGFYFTGVNMLLSVHCLLVMKSNFIACWWCWDISLWPDDMMLCFISRGHWREKVTFPGSSVLFPEQAFVGHSGRQCATPLQKHLLKAPGRWLASKSCQQALRWVHCSASAIPSPPRFWLSALVVRVLSCVHSIIGFSAPALGGSGCSLYL